MGKEVSESCVDSLLTETVSMYCNHLYANKPELAASRIDAIGYQVGHQLSERYIMERPRFTDRLDAIKFICKDFWSELFKKQIDNLKTNHRGTFVLQDNRFRWLSGICLDPSAEKGDTSQENSDASGEDKAATQILNMHLHFSCGVIRGALHNMGIACAVSADTSQLPACSFLMKDFPKNRYKRARKIGGAAVELKRQFTTFFFYNFRAKFMEKAIPWRIKHIVEDIIHLAREDQTLSISMFTAKQISLLTVSLKANTP